MSEILNYTPGQIVTFYEEVVDSDGQRTDDGYVPVVTRVILPGFAASPGFPQTMTRLSVGLYYFQLTLPIGAVAIGTYFVDIAYLDPNNLLIASDSRQIIVTAPYGNYAGTVPTAGSGGGGNPPTGPAGGDLFGYYPNPTVAKIQGTSVSANPPSINQVLEFDGSTWTPTSLPAPSGPIGPAGGDLGGTYPNPMVVNINGIAVSGSPSYGQVLTATSPTTATWQESLGGPPSGVAGGDLDGYYPNPTVSGLQTVPISPILPTVGQNLFYDGVNWVPYNFTGNLYSCPSSVSVADAVYSTGADTIDRAEANNSSTVPVIGFVSSKPTSTTAIIQYSGEVVGFSGLISGLTYYLSDTTPGAVTSIAPTTPGFVVQVVGFAKDPTTLVALIDRNIILL